MKTKEEMKIYRKERYEKNKDKIKIERDKPENKLKLKLYIEKWGEENKEHLQNYRDKPEIKERNKERYEKNKDKIKIERDKPENKLKLKEYQKKNYQDNKEQLKEYGKKWYAINKRYSQKVSLKKKYNLNIEDYDKMIEQQNNKCAICGKEETNTFKGKRVYLSVDHNQKTGQVRELLCKDCNVSLGNLKEDISLFYKCIEYLKQYQKEEPTYIDLKKDGLKITYSLTKEEYNKRAEQQNNKCAICRDIENGIRLALDHNWKTGKVRGLLCRKCNTTLGNLKEDISLFYKCIEYLKKWEGK